MVWRFATSTNRHTTIVRSNAQNEGKETDKMKLKDIDFQNMFVHAVASDVDTCYIIVDDAKTAACAWKVTIERHELGDDAFDVAARINTNLLDEMHGYALANPNEEVEDVAKFVDDTLMDEAVEWCDCLCTLVRI